jgi:hypothetical protein
VKVCPNCTTQNREGIFFCEECGQSLIGIISIATRTFQSQANGGTGGLGGSGGGTGTIGATDALPLSGQLRGAAQWGTASLAPNASLLIHVRDFPEPLKIAPGEAQQLIIGRIDPNTGARPEIDLAPYGAQEKGVSRSHAALRRMETSLTITDLGSVNGTYLNGQRLIAQQPRLLRDGDELRIGKVVMHVYFK